jgi:hypothetical protein
MIRVHCTGCQKRLKVKVDLAGRVFKCPRCRTAVKIPTLAENPPPEDPEPPEIEEPADVPVPPVQEPVAVKQEASAAVALPEEDELGIAAGGQIGGDLAPRAASPAKAAPAKVDFDCDFVVAEDATIGEITSGYAGEVDPPVQKGGAKGPSLVDLLIGDLLDGHVAEKPPQPVDELLSEDPAPGDSAVVVPERDDVEPPGHLPSKEPLTRLDGNNRYLILDRERLIGLWRNNGQGWRVRTKWGFVGAARNTDMLPTVGTFTFVELMVAHTDEGLRLRGIVCFRLLNQWALVCLNEGDDRILTKITEPGSLNRFQKAEIMKFLAEEFMDDVWVRSQQVTHFLGNDDCLSNGVLCSP